MQLCWVQTMLHKNIFKCDIIFRYLFPKCRRFITLYLNIILVVRFGIIKHYTINGLSNLGTLKLCTNNRTTYFIFRCKTIVNCRQYSWLIKKEYNQYFIAFFFFFFKWRKYLKVFEWNTYRKRLFLNFACKI